MSRPARTESATPARNTRNKPATPLPGLATKKSHAYGAQGKTNLHTQVRASGSNFAEDFTTGRVTRSRAASAQLSEEPEPATSPVKKAASRQRRGWQPQREPLAAAEEEEEEDVADDETTDPVRLTTALGQGLGYEPSATAARDGGRVFAIQEPSAWRIRKSTVLRAIAVCVLLMLLYGWVPLPSRLDDVRFEQFWGLGMFLRIPGYQKPPNYATELWYRARHDAMLAEMLPDHNMPEIQWAVNLNVLERLKRSETDTKELQSALGLHGETLKYLKSILPVAVVLQDGEEQSYQIPDPFWQALSHRIAQGGDEVSPLWESFISSNEERVQELSLRAATQIVGEAAEKKQLVSREDFVQSLERHNLELAERYTQDYQVLWAQNLQKVQEIAQKTAEDTLTRYTTDSMVKKQLDVLVKAVDVQNTHFLLRSYNWFTYGEGAVIDPHLTTATAEPPAARGFLNRVFGKSGPGAFIQNPPATVLLPWSEVTDCWCAASGKNGSAQITMVLNEPVFPEELIVEHMPAGGTRNIWNAPRTIEVWVDVGSATEAERFGNIIYEDSRGMIKQSDCTARPTDHHVCIGNAEYDIHQSNHIQRIAVWPDAQRIGLRSNRVTVRIVDNWGGPRTCLYRLRLLGNEEEVPDRDVDMLH